MNYFEKFKDQNVLVFGDFIADIYEYGVIKRMSREAPIPIVEYQSDRFVPGGAGNVVFNLNSLTARAIPLSAVGDDDSGQKLRKAFNDRQIETDSLLSSADLFTTSKKRILAQGEHTVRQQILRLDRFPEKPADERLLSRLWQAYRERLPQTQAVVISDYHLPVFPENFWLKVTELAVNSGKLTVVDSRRRLLEYKNVTLVTPNRSEAEVALGKNLRTDGDLRKAARRILEITGSQMVLITLGDEGMALSGQNLDFIHIPVSNKQEVFDVSGAGDTVVAAITLGLLSGMDPVAAAKFANLAAGIVVKKLGTATVTLEEIEKTRHVDEASLETLNDLENRPV